MGLGRWRWAILAVAVVGVGLGALRERQFTESETVTPASPVTVAGAESLDGPEQDVEAIAPWCFPLLVLTADDPSSVVASVFSSVAEIAPQSVSVDLAAAALVLESGPAAASTTTNTEVTGAQADFALEDAEGRVPEDDPVLRVADHIESQCRRTASNPGPAAIDPTLPDSEDESG